MMLKRITRSEATDLVRHCLESGEVQWGKHFTKALADEGVIFVDAQTVLQKGTIFEEPEQDIKSGDWKYRIEGHESGGKWLAIIFTFREVDRVFLITVFSIESRGKK